MTPSDLTRLAEIEARLADITRPPWYRFGAEGDASMVLSQGAANGHAPLVATFVKREDAVFAVEAPSDVRWLVRIVRESMALRKMGLQ